MRPAVFVLILPRKILKSDRRIPISGIYKLKHVGMEWLKEMVLAANPDDPSSIPGTYMAEGKNQLPTSCSPASTCIPTEKQINKDSANDMSLSDSVNCHCRGIIIKQEYNHL